MAASVNNYFIGKGIAYFKKDGESVFRDLGNVPEIEFTPNIEKLEHFSSRSGIRSKDLTVVLSKAGTLRVVLEEFTAENFALALLGETAVNASGRTYIDVFSESQISGVFKLTGTNEVGRNFELILNKVDFIPGSSVNFIGDDWGRLEISGDVSSVEPDGFGTLTDLDSSSGYSG